jgi:hypothetical protein
VCDRCKTKFPIEQLEKDPNFPGLRVCKDCVDVYDPWRLPPRATEDITLRGPRPDTPIPNVVSYAVRYTAKVGVFQVGELVIGRQSQASATVAALAAGQLTVVPVAGLSFTVGETLIGNTSGATGVCSSQQGVN